MKVKETLNYIQQNLKAPKGQYNSFGKYKYRSCEDILVAVKQLLGDAVLTLTDEIVVFGTPIIGVERLEQKNGDISITEYDVGTRIYVKATASLRVEGEAAIEVSAFAREPAQKKGMDDSQITGAASSYARKYALNGLFAIDDTKGADDTNKHGKTAPTSAATPILKTNLFSPYVEATGWSESKVKESLKSIGIDTAQKLKAARFDDILTILLEEKERTE